jgi:hypothetical protein
MENKPDANNSEFPRLHFGNVDIVIVEILKSIDMSLKKLVSQLEKGASGE